MYGLDLHPLVVGDDDVKWGFYSSWPLLYMFLLKVFEHYVHMMENSPKLCEM
jgi:hypothetical protein